MRLCPGCGAAVAPTADACVCGLPLLDRKALWTLNTDTSWTVQLFLMVLGAFLVALGGMLPTEARGLGATVAYGITALLLLGVGGIFVVGSVRLMWMGLRGKAEWGARVESSGGRGRYDATATVLLHHGKLVSGEGRMRHQGPPEQRPATAAPTVVPPALADWLAWAWALRALEVFWDTTRTWTLEEGGMHQATSGGLTLLRLDAAPASADLVRLFQALQLGATPVLLADVVGRVPPDLGDAPAGSTRERAHLRQLLHPSPPPTDVH